MTTEERLRSLLEAENEGGWSVAQSVPWHVDEDDDGYFSIRFHGDGIRTAVSGYVATALLGDDAALIVESVNALPKLLAVVAAAREVIASCDYVNGTAQNIADDRKLDRLERAVAAWDEEGKR